MLNLPSPQSVLPLDLGVMSLVEPEMLPAASRVLPEFAGLMAAAAGGDPAAAGAVETAIPVAETDQPDPETPAIAQAWAQLLVPELANLPAPLPPPPTPLEEFGAAAGDAASLTVAGDGPWPQRAYASPRLAGLLPAADPARPRGWQVALPAAPIPPAPAPADPVVRNITGQPIPYPTADQPPWFDPNRAPPWFDPANPPPAWSDPTQPAPLWYDPTQVPPAWLDPVRIPAAWFDTARPALAAASVATPAVALPPLAVDAERAPPVIAGLPVPVTPGHRQGAAQPVADQPPAAEPIPAAERADAPPAPAVMLPPAVASAAPAPLPAASASPPAQTPAPPPLPAAPDPALAIASDRLGDVAVRLSGSADQLQVMMQAQPAAAALIDAAAPRLSQDLAAAGVALAGLSVNGQRADLSGGQRDRQRQTSRRSDETAIASVRRLSAQAATPRANLNIDRFA